MEYLFVKIIPTGVRIIPTDKQNLFVYIAYNKNGEIMTSFVVVEDSIDFRRKIVNIIKNYKGTQIIGEYDNANDAINSLNNNIPDVALIDIQLLSGNGIDILRAIRSRGLQTKVIMMTNYPYVEYRLECLKLGCDYFIQKTKDLDKLFTVIECLAQ